MSDIKLNFINESNDVNNREIVIFQKNVAESFDEITVAWKVIKNCATGWEHPFQFPMQMSIEANNSWGDEIISSLQTIEEGQSFAVKSGQSGDALEYIEQSESQTGVELQNNLGSGSLDARIYRGGKLLAHKKEISPSQKAVFEFKPILYIGVVSQVEEGQALDPAIMNSINNELSIQGLSSADIVMTGGGKDPFNFELKNVVMN